MDYHYGLIKMRVQFVIKLAVSFGKNVYVCGSNSELGSWNTGKAVKLQWGKDNIWCIEVDISSDSNVVYKYFTKEDKEGSVEWENGNNRKLSLSYNVPTSSSQHSTVTVLTTRIIQVRDYWQNGDAISEPAQLSKDQTETGSSSACLSQFAELQYRKKEIDKLITTLQAVELENLHLQGECLDGLKLRQLQKLQQRLAESFFKVNRAIVDIVEKEQCTICFENERNVVLVPCGICESIGNNILGHLIICNTCAERDLKSCPYCRVRVQSKQRVFF